MIGGWFYLSLAGMLVYGASLPGELWLTSIQALMVILYIIIAYVFFASRDLERSIDAQLKRIMEEDPCEWQFPKPKADHFEAGK